jgi:hypothetical protein
MAIVDLVCPFALTTHATKLWNGQYTNWINIVSR